MTTKERIQWIAAVGVTCNLAVSIKWTALATPGMIAVESLMAVFFLKKPGACKLANHSHFALRVVAARGS